MRFCFKNRKREDKKEKKIKEEGKERKKNMSEDRTLPFKLKPCHLLLSKAFPLSLAWLAFLRKKKWFLIIPMFTCVRHLVQCFMGSKGHIHLIA